MPLMSRIRLRRSAGDPVSCRELVELVTDYLEDALPAPERRRVDAHLAHCPHCSAYLEQLGATLDALGTLTEDDLSEPARDDLLEVFRAFLAEGGAGPA